MSPNKLILKNIVIIDSNFILLPFQFKIDFLEEINSSLEGITNFIIFKQVFDELEAKRRREPKATKFQKYLRSGLSYLEQNKEKYGIIFNGAIKIHEETADDFLLQKAIDYKNEGQNVFLATNDRLLREKAREAQIGIIFLRQKKYLSIERG